MSGKPNPDGVRKLMFHAREWRRNSRRALELTEQISKAERELGDAQERSRLSHGYLIKQLEEMDCAANGNHGWGGRIAWMLAELVDAANKADFAKEPTDDQ